MKWILCESSLNRLYYRRLGEKTHYDIPTVLIIDWIMNFYFCVTPRLIRVNPRRECLTILKSQAVWYFCRCRGIMDLTLSFFTNICYIIEYCLKTHSKKYIKFILNIIIYTYWVRYFLLFILRDIIHFK